MTRLELVTDTTREREVGQLEQGDLFLFGGRPWVRSGLDRSHVTGNTRYWCQQLGDEGQLKSLDTTLGVKHLPAARLRY